MPKIKGTPTVRFTLFSTKEPLKPTYITLYFHYRGGRLKFSTGEKVCPDGWDFAKQRAVCNRKYPEGADINTTLNTLEEFTKRIYRDTNLGNITPAAFSHALDVRMGYVPEVEEVKPPTLFEFFESYTKTYKIQHPDARNTWKGYGLALNQLKKYAADKGVKVDYKNINDEFFEAFKAWLYAAPRGYRVNYASSLFKTLRLFMRLSLEKKYHDNTAFEKFKLAEIETDEIALSFKELQSISELDLQNERLDRIRDVFLIGCFTGLRFSDYNRITPEHIISEGEIKMLSITTTKTRAQVKIPLYPILERLLRKYDFNIPTKSLQNFNGGIKEVAKLAGLTDTMLIRDSPGGIVKEYEVARYSMISTHTARRSFATNMILAGVPVFLIMAILKHKTEAQTRHYARISESQAAQGFSVEIDKMKERPEAAYLFK